MIFCKRSHWKKSLPSLSTRFNLDWTLEAWINTEEGHWSNSVQSSTSLSPKIPPLSHDICPTHGDMTAVKPPIGPLTFALFYIQGHESSICPALCDTVLFAWLKAVRLWHFWDRSGVDGIRFLCCFWFFFDSCFFRMKEPSLATTAGYKGRRQHPSHNMKLFKFFY